MAKPVAHSYGKDAVSVYRIEGDNLFACEARVIVRGDAFETSYTEGDNSLVVATDSMKNFVHRMGLEYEGDTLEGFVALVGGRLLERYEHMGRRPGRTRRPGSVRARAGQRAAPPL